MLSASPSWIPSVFSARLSGSCSIPTTSKSSPKRNGLNGPAPRLGQQKIPPVQFEFNRAPLLSVLSHRKTPLLFPKLRRFNVGCPVFPSIPMPGGRQHQTCSATAAIDVSYQKRPPPGGKRHFPLTDFPGIRNLLCPQKQFLVNYFQFGQHSDLLSPLWITPM